MLSRIAQVNFLLLSKFRTITNAKFVDVLGDSIICGSLDGEIQIRDLNTPDSQIMFAGLQPSEFDRSHWNKINYSPGNFFFLFLIQVGRKIIFEDKGVSSEIIGSGVQF
jgi:hypothetical protein